MARPTGVVVDATGGPDTVTASGSAGSASLPGLTATVNLTHAEVLRDTLTINALAGDAPASPPMRLGSSRPAARETTCWLVAPATASTAALAMTW